VTLAFALYYQEVRPTKFGCFDRSKVTKFIFGLLVALFTFCLVLSIILWIVDYLVRNDTKVPIIDYRATQFCCWISLKQSVLLEFLFGYMWVVFIYIGILFFYAQIMIKKIKIGTLTCECNCGLNWYLLIHVSLLLLVVAYGIIAGFRYLVNQKNHEEDVKIYFLFWFAFVLNLKGILNFIVSYNLFVSIKEPDSY